MPVTTTITPYKINLKGNFMGSIWQNIETEASAYWLCKMARVNGSWRDFTQEEIDKVSGHDFWFNKLMVKNDNWAHFPGAFDYIVFNPKTKKYSFTDQFIIECHRLSPKK